MNLRIDRYDFVDRMINLISIKKLIKKKKIRNIKIISDNTTTLNIFDNLSLNIEKVDYLKKIIFNFKKIKIINFYIKTTILIFFVKLMGKPFVISKKKKKSFLYLYTPIIFRTVKKISLKRKKYL